MVGAPTIVRALPALVVCVRQFGLDALSGDAPIHESTVLEHQKCESCCTGAPGPVLLAALVVCVRQFGLDALSGDARVNVEALWTPRRS